MHYASAFISLCFPFHYTFTLFRHSLFIATDSGQRLTQTPQLFDWEESFRYLLTNFHNIITKQKFDISSRLQADLFKAEPLQHCAGIVFPIQTEPGQ